MIPQDVYLLPTTEEDEEASKQRQLGDGYHIFVSREENTLQEAQLGCTTKGAHDNPSNILCPFSTSRVIGSVDIGMHEETLLKSTLITKEAMDMYLKGEEKLRKGLHLISLEDHDWKLKSWDQDNEYVLILYCFECAKDFGGKTGLHSKDKVTNIFSI